MAKDRDRSRKAGLMAAGAGAAVGAAGAGKYLAFSEELIKIAEDRRDRAREAARHSLAAGAGTAAGVAAADILAGQLAKRRPDLVPVIKSRAARYGVPGLMAAGSVYASHKYKKNVDDALQRMVGGDE